MPADTTPDPAREPARDPALDPAIIAELQHAQRECGNPAFIAQLIALFRANAPIRLARIREAVAARDGSTLGHTAHTLKSNCAMLGATKLAQMCARLEAWGDGGSVESACGEAEQLLVGADAELARVLAALEELDAGAGSVVRSR